MSNNVTIHPDAMACPVENPSVEYVMDTKTGISFSSDSLLSMPQGDVGKLRVKTESLIKQNNPMYACPFCGEALAIRMSPLKRPFFMHYGRNPAAEERCPVIQQHGLSKGEILAAKFNGAQESEDHKAFKRMVIECLERDHAFTDVSGIRESVWRSREEATRYRRPDVQATYQTKEGEPLRIAFEVQLSTTFLSVVVGRREFYRDEGGLVVWVLPDFTPSFRRQTDDDILYSNNRNVIVVNAETMEASKASGQFQVLCFYQYAKADRGWKHQMVRFSELTLDMDGQRAFLYDYETENLTEEASVRDDELRERIKKSAEKLRHYDDLEIILSEIKSRLGLSFKNDRRFQENFYNGIKAMHSARVGSTVGFGFANLIQVGTHIKDNYPHFMGAFLKTCEDNAYTHLLKSKNSPSWYELQRNKVRSADTRDKLKMTEPLRGIFIFLFRELQV